MPLRKSSVISITGIIAAAGEKPKGAMLREITRSGCYQRFRLVWITNQGVILASLHFAIIAPINTLNAMYENE